MKLHSMLAGALLAGALLAGAAVQAATFTITGGAPLHPARRRRLEDVRSRPRRPGLGAGDSVSATACSASPARAG